MRGVTVAALAAIALAAVAWLLVFDDPATPVQDVVDADGPAPDANAGPSLTGSAKSAPRADAARGEGAVDGLVLTDDGEPAPGVTILARRQLHFEPWRNSRTRVADDLRTTLETGNPAPIVARTTSDAQGRFRLTGLEIDKSHFVVADVAAPQTSSRAIAVPRRQEEPARVRLVLGTGTPLRGRVVDRHDNGVAAWVTVTSRYDSRYPRSYVGPTRTDADGAFRFDAVGPGPFEVEAHVRGVGSVTDRGLRMPREDEIVLRFDVDGGATIRGTVRDTSGQPVPTARIAAAVKLAGRSTYDRLVQYRATAVASDGTYSLSGFPAGALVGLSVAAAGYVPREGLAEGLAVPDGATLTMDVTLVRGATLRGRVLTPDGKPIVGASVAFAAGDDPQHMFLGALLIRSGAGGQYVIDALPPAGRGRLIAEADGYYQERSGADENDIFAWGKIDFGQRVSIDTEGQVIETDIVLKPGVRLSGVVRTRDGQPVAGARITRTNFEDGGMGSYDPWAGSVDFAPVRTDADGRFDNVLLRPGSAWTFHAKRDELVGASVNVRVHRNAKTLKPIEFVIGPGATVKGRVIYASGDPAPRVWVEVAGESVTTDRRGRFEVSNLAPGTHVVDATHRHHYHHGNRKKQEVTVTWGQVVDDIEIELEDTRALSGIVVDEAGEPVAGCNVKVKVFATSGEQLRSATSGADGSFRMDSLPVARLRVSTTAMDEPLDLPEARADVRLLGEAPQAVVLHGRVFAPDGSPVAEGSYTLEWSSASSSSSHSGLAISDGYFRHEETGSFDKIALKVDVAKDVFGRSMDFLSESVSLDPSSETPTEIRLRAGRTISGVVVDEQGRGVPEVLVVRPHDNEFFSFEFLGWFMDESTRRRTDDKGAFALTAPADGQVKLWIRPPEAFTTPKPLAVSPDQTKLRVVLRKATGIAGTVTLPDGTPASDAQVTAQAPGDLPEFSARCDAKGRFEIKGVHPDRTYELLVKELKNDDTSYLKSRMEGVAAGRQDVRIELRLGAYIRGTVTTEDGSALPDHTVALVEKDGSVDWDAPTASNTDKAFELGPVEPGVHRIVVRGQGDWGHSDPIEVRAPADGVKLVLPRGYPVRGTVQGTKRAGFLVSAIVRGDRVDSTGLDDDGTFMISHHEPRTVTLFFHKDDDPRYAVVEGVKGRSDIKVTLREGKTIEGSISGVPIKKGMRIQAAQDGKVVSATVQSDGTYRLQGLPDGKWTVYVYESKLEVHKDVPAGSRGIDLIPLPPDAPEASVPAPPSCGNSSCGTCGGSCG